MTTIEELLTEDADRKAAYDLKLVIAKRCAICGTNLGDLNGPDGEAYLRRHYERDHPGEPIRTEVIK